VRIVKFLFRSVELLKVIRTECIVVEIGGVWGEIWNYLKE